ncbi:hypothetical protein RHMOL_Rhmol03G0016700 [Rhododendron molle]|uniref:Uncharacterized protein n=1 Tax=Rhododendron molle TaxID=49168 RepID=A0ACC0P983_RHOML|nr:hypothetical protein RHMOL_Rhmol03G0016700 [Rhododendron molle]
MWVRNQLREELNRRLGFRICPPVSEIKPPPPRVPPPPPSTRSSTSSPFALPASASSSPPLPSPFTVFSLLLITYFGIVSGIIYDVIVKPPGIGSTQDHHTGTVKPVIFLPGRVNSQYIIDRPDPYTPCPPPMIGRGSYEPRPQRLLRASSAWLALQAHRFSEIKHKCRHIISYAFNFDDGVGPNDHFDFSSRYAAIPVLAKLLMDLGRDAPVFR